MLYASTRSGLMDVVQRLTSEQAYAPAILLQLLITSVEEVMFCSCLRVCLCLSVCAQNISKSHKKILMIFWTDGTWPRDQWVRFWWRSECPSPTFAPIFHHVMHFEYDNRFKDIGVAALTFWGHVTSSITWPLDSLYAVSYRWSFETIALSRIVVEILCVKHLAKHIPIENALTPFFCLWEQNCSLLIFARWQH